jgi:FtsH-binding integral membrane protein
MNNPPNYNSTTYPQNNNNQYQGLEEGESPKSIDAQLRIGFVRKVYGILTMQLLITVFFCALTFNLSVNKFLKTHIYLFWICFGLSLAIVIPLICFQEIARKTPLNYILLFGFTFCETYMVATACCFYNPKIVMAAVALTAAVVIALTIYACTTDTDFTWMGGLLFVGIVLLLCLSILAFFLPFLHTLICVLGVFIFSIYLIFDTQLIMGKFGNAYSIDDYIIAALNVYLDIIQIFLYLLQILGGR